MTMPEPSFIFFRSHPATDEARIALASSMQSLDSVLLLIALRRYPHALITCDAAIESAIKLSSAGKTLPERVGFQKLIEAAKRASNELAALADKALSDFRAARNRMTHEGFSPRDDSESVGLLLEVGLPFLQQCYLHLFSFDLQDALHPEYVRQLTIGTEVYVRAKEVVGLDRSYCLKSLGHLIRSSLKVNFSADWEIQELVKSEELGMGFEFKHEQRQKLERLFSPEWVFDCPLCGDPQAVVCQLDESELRAGNILPERLACTNCGLVVGTADLFLSEALLKGEVETARRAILKDYGF
jgi:hypothetical protein